MEDAHKKLLRSQHISLLIINGVLNGLFVFLLNLNATRIPVMPHADYAQSIRLDLFATGILLCFLLTLLVPLGARKKIRLGTLPTIPRTAAGWIGKLPRNPWLLSTLMAVCGILVGLLLAQILSQFAPFYSIPAYAAIKVVIACLLTALCVQVAIVRSFCQE